MRNHTTLGQGPLDALKGVLSSGSAQLVVRSNFTPEITIDVSKLVKTGEEKTAVQGQNATVMRLIKPEVIVRGLGIEKSIAPYGRPEAGMFTIIAVGAGAAAVLGGMIAWKLCRR